MKSEDFQATVVRILSEVTTMTLATCSGVLPWATDVYFAPDGFNLIFLSAPDSRHCRNLAVNSNAAVTIHLVAASWQDIKGLQIAGAWQPVTTLTAKARAYAAYFNKFPFARNLLSNPEGAAPSIRKVTVHTLRPSYIRLVDNSCGFGTRYAVYLQEGVLAGPPQRE